MSANVAIIMGSDSDLPVMQPAADILAELGGRAAGEEVPVDDGFLVRWRRRGDLASLGPC